MAGKWKVQKEEQIVAALRKLMQVRRPHDSLCSSHARCVVFDLQADIDSDVLFKKLGYAGVVSLAPGMIWNIVGSFVSSYWPAALTFTNNQSIEKAHEVAELHYDIPTALFEHMLGSTMQYSFAPSPLFFLLHCRMLLLCSVVHSCGYWTGAKTLDEAQQNKIKLIAAKLSLSPDFEGFALTDVIFFSGWPIVPPQQYNTERLWISEAAGVRCVASWRCFVPRRR